MLSLLHLIWVINPNTVNTVQLRQLESWTWTWPPFRVLVSGDVNSYRSSHSPPCTWRSTWHRVCGESLPRHTSHVTHTWLVTRRRNVTPVIAWQQCTCSLFLSFSGVSFVQEDSMGVIRCSLLPSQIRFRACYLPLLHLSTNQKSWYTLL